MTGDAGQDQKPAPGILGCWCRIIGRICTSNVLHTISHVAWLGVKALAVLLFILWAIGIPGGLVVHYFQPVVEPYQIELQRITWSPLRGLLIRRLQITEPTLSGKPVLTADACVIRPDYQNLLSRKWTTRQIEVENGRLSFPVPSTPLADASDASMDIHSIVGTVEFTGQDTRLAVSGITDIGTKCLISGSIVTREGTEEKIDARAWIQQIRDMHTSTVRTPDWIIALREKIQSIQFSTPPQATLLFAVDRDYPGRNTGKLSFHSTAFDFEGESYDGIEMNGDFSGSVYHIRQAELKQGDNKFNLTGHYDATRDVFEAHARNNLPMNAIAAFFPATWRARMTEMDMRFSGILLAEGWIGPCRISEVPASWSGWTSVENAAVNELRVTKAFASIKRNGHLLSIEDGILEGGTGIGQGSVTFTVKTDFSNRTTRGNLDVGIDLRQLKPLLTRGLRRVADMFEIRERPVMFNGSFMVPHDDVNQTVVAGSIFATNVAFRGVDVTGLNSYLTYTNRSVILNPLLATCRTGSITGSLNLDLPAQLYGINLEITTNPKVVAPMAGKKFAQYLEPYFFTDSILVRANGQVDTKKDKATDLQVYISGQQIGITNLVCDRLMLQGRRTSGFLMISNILGQVFQGSVTGQLAITFEEDRTTFDLAAEARDILMDKLAKNFIPSATNVYEGVMSGRARLAGPFPDRPGWTNLQGSGSIQIENGRLLRIPLLGGLSSILSKIYPGLGFSEQNFLTADVSVREGAVFTDNLKLSGRVISLAADGKYYFTDHLDFDVRVHPFRDGSIASAVRIVTIPISMLLEFNVSGPARNPVWSASNLPL